jgi:DUF4097 and DUF4098 domain-containing protein YvlB
MTVPHRLLTAALVLLAGVAPLGCGVGMGATGQFDRSFDVGGHTRVEVSNTSGDLEIVGAADGKVHIRAEVKARGIGFGDPKERLAQILSNPGIEQKGDTIRIGKDISNLRYASITYRIEVPHDTEVNSTVMSGGQIIRGIRGPVTAQGASGSIRAEQIERDTRLTTASGSVNANDIGDDVRANSASGGITVNNAKGEVRANTMSGDIQVHHPGGRVEADSASGSIDILGATADAKAHGLSGSITLQGDPGQHGYWDLKTASGRVRMNVPDSASFRFSAQSTSGEIRTDIPIVIEEQGKHSLRARIGNEGGRVEVKTISGEIQIGAVK